jgi:hypothetical protein
LTLERARTATRLPARDLHRARAFYSEKLAELRGRAVVFEEYDFPGLTTVNGIAEIEGNYPSKGKGERGAWFRDSEGNMLGLGQPVR